MMKILKSFLLIILSLFFSSMSCEDGAPERETIDFQFFHNMPGSCPTYFFNTLDSHVAHIPTESSNSVIKAFLKDQPDATKVSISLQKTGKIIQHECGDREPNPKLHPFVEIEIFSISER
ncbi:hypothetical protein [Emticicia sp. C21]|uniref:hypothetical protein n=1 Tax=Emticicia sp. C21 TaxID=2302915 RepID=UPI000E9224D8|nr:hypothetical protein [Emticicia sp. C21]RFS14732.1 hypothetical protein D0T08_18900 [Emticicia sp. C21]